ncbi:MULTISPECIES: hypothetical protein [unclassified Thioalkalivibrio]|uniref:hypothetical protein n=1 Tax=unclassified Thioalkalivibrio TaxID=2621013 RepID=UPI00037B0740|nr:MULTISPECIES: hypothetical protein [unclassified Thioalkalivibrio]
MWVFLPDCAVSIVAHRDHEDSLLVRARLRGDLERFLAGCEEAGGVTETPDADYRFRAVVQRSVVGAILSDQAAGMEYDNFKNQVRPDEDLRHSWYYRAWQSGLNCQESERRFEPPYWLEEPAEP